MGGIFPPKCSSSLGLLSERCLLINYSPRIFGALYPTWSQETLRWNSVNGFNVETLGPTHIRVTWHQTSWLYHAYVRTGYHSQHIVHEDPAQLQPPTCTNVIRQVARAQMTQQDLSFQVLCSLLSTSIRVDKSFKVLRFGLRAITECNLFRL